jgi:hypothetical protein
MAKKQHLATEPDVTVIVAQHVLWHLGDENLGVQPGDFVKRLLRLMAVADSDNEVALTATFPGYAEAFFAWKHSKPWAIDWLRDKVKKAAA